jgi:small subunit ribosomal protein S16
MVLKIRLARWGARNNPFYGIVLAHQRAARDGKHLERLGTFNPIAGSDGTKHVELNGERIKYWIGQGAQPTERVAWILAKVSTFSFDTTCCINIHIHIHIY